MARDSAAQAAFLGASETNTAATLFALSAVSTSTAKTSTQQKSSKASKGIPKVVESQSASEVEEKTVPPVVSKVASAQVIVEAKATNKLDAAVVSKTTVIKAEATEPLSVNNEQAKSASKDKIIPKESTQPGGLAVVFGVALAASIVALAMVFGRKKK